MSGHLPLLLLVLPEDQRGTLTSGAVTLDTIAVQIGGLERQICQPWQDLDLRVDPWLPRSSDCYCLLYATTLRIHLWQSLGF